MKVKLIKLIKEADSNTRDIATFDSNGFIFVAELMNCSTNDFIENKEYEVDVKFYCHKVCGIYKDEKEFHKKEKSMDTESFIPMGSFPANPNDKNWLPSALNYINSIVSEVVDNASVNVPENLVLFYGRLLGQQIDQILYYPNVKDKVDIKVNDIISCVYWAELDKVEVKEELC